MFKFYFLSIILTAYLVVSSCTSKEPSYADPLQSILAKGDTTLIKILEKAEQHEIQIRYTQVDRDKNNEPILTSFSFREDENKYFYPASTVKMPVAFLALQRLNELQEKTS